MFAFIEGSISVGETQTRAREGRVVNRGESPVLSSTDYVEVGEDEMKF